MNSNNITNAFSVVEETYKNIDKFIEYCRTRTLDESCNYEMITPKFLRARSDQKVASNLLTGIILLFQYKQDASAENEEDGEYQIKDGSVYVLFIDICYSGEYDCPMIYLAKYDYKDMSKFHIPGQGEYYRFYNPMFEDDAIVKYTDCSKLPNGFIGEVKDVDLADKHWLGIRKIVGYSIKLEEITTAEDVNSKLFDGFDELRSVNC
jgi:hypothetical protein